VKSPLELARAFPESNRISLSYSKKLPKFAKDGCHVDLIWMGFIVEYIFSCMDGVGDDDNFGNVFFAVCLTNTASHGKEFRFCAGNKGHMCYDSMLKVLSKELTLVWSDTRELNRVPSTK